MFNFVRIYSGVSKALYLLEATTSFPAIFKINKRQANEKKKEEEERRRKKKKEEEERRRRRKTKKG